jgi:hypothetical protein
MRIGRRARSRSRTLYKNNRDGTFTDVTEKSGLGRTGWQTGVCVGDYDNDGWDDLFCCFWGHNILFHNNGNGTFTDVHAKPALLSRKAVGAQAALSSIMTGTGTSIFSFAISSSLIRTRFHRRKKRISASGKASPPCAARAAFRGHEPALPQQRRRYVYRCFREGWDSEARAALLHHRHLLRFRQRRVARHLCRGRLRTQHPVQEQSRRHIHRCRRHGRLRLQRRRARTGRNGSSRGRL